MPNLNMLPMASTKTPVGASMYRLSPGREELERLTMTAVFGTSATNAQDQDQIARTVMGREKLSTMWTRGAKNKRPESRSLPAQRVLEKCRHLTLGLGQPNNRGKQ